MLEIQIILQIFLQTTNVVSAYEKVMLVVDLDNNQ